MFKILWVLRDFNDPFFYNFMFIDKTHITVAKFKTKRKYIMILQIG